MSFQNILPILRGAALLDEQTFIDIRDSKNAFRTGVTLLLLIFLVAGSLQFVVDLVDHLRPFTPEAAETFQNDFLGGFEQWQQFMPSQDPNFQIFMDQFRENFRIGVNIGVEIDQMPRPLGRGLGIFFETLGGWLSHPLGKLGGWLAYSIWVLLFARLLGGNGGVDRFLGVTALFAVPNLLSIFQPIPCIGSLLAVVGMVWGWVIYVKAVQVSQRFDLGKAILATLLPILLLLVLIGIILLIAIIGIVAASG